MKSIAVYDRKDYDLSSPRFIRESSRAIIIAEGRIALLFTAKYGMYTFPGGRIEAGETGVDALIRETMEETGLIVKPRSVKEYGMVAEIRRDMKADGIFEQRDYFYTCDVEDEAMEPSLSQGERESGYRLARVPLAEAIAVNELEIRTGRRFSERETHVLKLLRDSHYQ